MFVKIEGEVDKCLVDWISSIKSDLSIINLRLTRMTLDNQEGIDMIWHTDTGTRGTFGTLEQWWRMMEAAPS